MVDFGGFLASFDELLRAVLHHSWCKTERSEIRGRRQWSVVGDQWSGKAKAVTGGLGLVWGLGSSFQKLGGPNLGAVFEFVRGGTWTHLA